MALRPLPSATGRRLGAVKELWRYPVKSMLGEEVDAFEVTAGGICGDRAFALRDKATGKVASAKNPKLWPDLLACRATFVAEPRVDETPPVRIELGDGTVVRSDAPDVDVVLSRFFGRDVELARSAANGYAIDQYHPDEAGYDPEGHRDEVVEIRLGAGFFDDRSLPSAVAEGSFLDLFPVSVISTSSLERFGNLQPSSRFDGRRFRMNLTVETAEPGFVENHWVGHTVAVGGDVRFGVAMPDPRCVMPSLAQATLPKDFGILKALVLHNRLEVAGSRFPCAGVYAVVDAAGSVRCDDAVVLL